VIVRIGVRAACAVFIAAGAVAACTPIPSVSESYAPANTCPAFSCAEYSSGSAATCQGGVCVVSAPTASIDGLIVVVALPTDSSYAPGRTFAITWQDLTTAKTSNGCSAPDCCLPVCAPLPYIEVVSHLYLIAPSLESANGGVDWYLGNPGAYGTVLPVQATYRPLWDGSAGPYATSLGLPLEPIQAFSFPFSVAFPGPGGGPSIVVQTYLQTGLSYQLTDQPDPPFSAAYPPEILEFTATDTGDVPLAASLTTQFDLTSGTVAAESGDAGPLEIPTKTLPTFDLSRSAGLSGWTAYLRDATNLNTVSNIVALAGTESPHVVLATNRFGGAGTDALTNAQLVIAPPAGVVAPTEVLTPAGGELPSTETYPPMPDPVSVTAAVTAGASGAAAELTFEATSILVGGVETLSNFTYTTRASTAIDATTGRSIFSVQLPPGQYLVVARPVAGAPASSAVTLTALDVPEFGPYLAPGVALASTQPVGGTLVAADGRPLSQATIEAIPAACAPLPGGLDDSPFLSTIACLPRPAQTASAADGSFSLALDPGQYLLRARPADGTGFPWVTRSISVANEPVTLGRIVVPLPVSLGLRLVDPTMNGNPIVQALVSVYSLPASGPAIELGSALTDGNGQYEMFVALAQP